MLAYLVSLPVVHLVARARPFVVTPQAVVLVTKPAGFSFPNEHTVIAGALATGIWLGRSRLLAAVATLVALVLALAVVYTGVAYPGDAAAGLLIGTLVTVALYPIAGGSLRELVHLVARSPLKFLVGSGSRKAFGPGPAARPEQVGDSGTVRLLAPDEVRAVRALPSARTEQPAPCDLTRRARSTSCRLGKLEPCPTGTRVNLGWSANVSRREAHQGRCGAEEAQATCNRQVVGLSPTTGSLSIYVMSRIGDDVSSTPSSPGLPARLGSGGSARSCRECDPTTAPGGNSRLVKAVGAC